MTNNDKKQLVSLLNKYMDELAKEDDSNKRMRKDEKASYWECKSPEWHAELQRMRFEQAAGIKRQALVKDPEPKTGDLKRTEKGAIWYPVSGREIQQIARETHRTYREVCAEFLSKQVRVGG